MTADQYERRLDDAFDEIGTLLEEHLDPRTIDPTGPVIAHPMDRVRAAANRHYGKYEGGYFVADTVANRFPVDVLCRRLFVTGVLVGWRAGGASWPLREEGDGDV